MSHTSVVDQRERTLQAPAFFAQSPAAARKALAGEKTKPE
jgi:hypothetical protein